MFAFWRRPALLASVIVSMKNDPHVFTGVLTEARGPWLVLRRAAEVSGPERVVLDGEVFLPREHVLFVQVPPVE